MKKFLTKSCAIKIMQKHINNKLNCGAHLPQPPGVMSPIKKAVSWSSRIFIFRNNAVGGITRRAAFPRLPLYVLDYILNINLCGALSEPAVAPVSIICVLSRVPGAAEEGAAGAVAPPKF